MAVEINFAIGYGTTIEPDVFASIEEMISDDDDRDMWCDRWAQCLNTWTGDDYFVGITYTVIDCDDTVKDFNEDKYALSLEDEEAFLKFYNKYHLEKFFEWKPDCCAIAFIW